MLAENNDVHPAAFVIVYEYVPAASPEIVVLAPDPEITPGFKVHVPEGNPVKITLPVLNEHVGSVIVPTVGAAGVTG